MRVKDPRNTRVGSTDGPTAWVHIHLDPSHAEKTLVFEVGRRITPAYTPEQSGSFWDITLRLPRRGRKGVF